MVSTTHWSPINILFFHFSVFRRELRAFSRVRITREPNTILAIRVRRLLTSWSLWLATAMLRNHKRNWYNFLCKRKCNKCTARHAHTHQKNKYLLLKIIYCIFAFFAIRLNVDRFVYGVRCTSSSSYDSYTKFNAMKHCTVQCQPTTSSCPCGMTNAEHTNTYDYRPTTTNIIIASMANSCRRIYSKIFVLFRLRERKNDNFWPECVCWAAKSYVMFECGDCSCGIFSSTAEAGLGWQ